jgi:hypothetical protein
MQIAVDWLRLGIDVKLWSQQISFLLVPRQEKERATRKAGRQKQGRQALPTWPIHGAVVCQVGLIILASTRNLLIHMAKVRWEVGGRYPVCSTWGGRRGCVGRLCNGCPLLAGAPLPPCSR